MYKTTHITHIVYRDSHTNHPKTGDNHVEKRKKKKEGKSVHYSYFI